MADDSLLEKDAALPNESDPEIECMMFGIFAPEADIRHPPPEAHDCDL